MLHPRRRDDQERGQIIVLFALVLVVILVFAAIVVDVGLLRNNRQTLANAMDAGALAGGTLLPVDGTQTGATAAINGRVNNAVQATYPGIPTSAYTIAYRCLIGVDTSTPPQPFISRDIPLVCDPTHALGHAPRTTDFIGAGQTRSSDCRPDLGDRCNVVVVQGAISTNYTFGNVVGINKGSTGAVTSSACNGPCGQAPLTSLDVVVILDRTDSMSGQEGSLRTAANAVLQVYDPKWQHVALGFLGPSSVSRTCSGSPSGVRAVAMDPQTLQPPSHVSDTAADRLGNSLSIARPNSTVNGSFLIAQILVNNGTNTAITPPAGWTLVRRTDSGTSLGQALYSRIATGSEPSSYTWTFNTSVDANGGISNYSGVDLSNPFDPAGAAGNVGSGNSGSGNTLTANAITTSSTQTRDIAFFGFRNDTGISTPSGMNEQYENLANSTQDTAISADDQSDATAGSTGTRVATATGTSSPWIAQLVALRADPPDDTYGTVAPGDLGKWVPIGLTGTANPANGDPAGPINEAYATNGVLNTSSQIVKAISCFDLSGVGTNLTTPMEMALYYLQHNARPQNPTHKWGIILETDGAPNFTGYGSQADHTCTQASAAAAAAKAAGVEIFTIGFDVGSERCDDPMENSTWRNQPATTLLANMASDSTTGPAACNAAENADGDHFFCEPNAANLKNVFQQAAVQLAGLHSHLIQVYPVPVITSFNPSTGSHLGGTTVTITGKYFTGATRVTFGGADALSFTVNSDTSISARAPAGTTGAQVKVSVITPGGFALTDTTYTYN